MKKFLLIIFTLLLSMILFPIILFACSFDLTTQDLMMMKGEWEYVLPNEYRIWAVNTTVVVCGKKTTEYSLSNVGGDNVVQFCFDERYVCLKCVDKSVDISKEIDSADIGYYIVDTVMDEVRGPFSGVKYKTELDMITDVQVSEWINTHPTPQGVVYGES